MRRRKRGAGPIYAFIVVWLLCSLAAPLYKLGWLIAAAVLALGGAFATAAIAASARKKRGEEDPEPEPEPEPAVSYGPEVDGIIADGKLALAEMGRLYGSISDPNVRKKINELMRVSDKIIQDAIGDPSDVPQIRKFLNYYLPTTIKLLNAYDRMSAQGIEGENLSKSMQSIEDMLDTTIEAYKKQLDSLFENQAMDIETDISVMNRLMARQGLTGGGELDELISKAAKQQLEREEASRQAQAAQIAESARMKAEAEAREAKAKADAEARQQAEASAKQARQAALEAQARLAEMEKKQEFTSAEEAMKDAARGSYGDGGSSAAEQDKQ